MNIDNIINNEVHCLVNGLVEFYLRNTHDYPFDESRFFTCESDIFQYYIVSDWLSRKLEDQGEIIIEIEGHNIWCRQTCGQALRMDACFVNIKNEYTPLALDNECINTIEWIGSRYSYADILRSCYVGQDLNSLEEERKIKLYYALETEGTPLLAGGYFMDLLSRFTNENYWVEEAPLYWELKEQDEEEENEEC